MILALLTLFTALAISAVAAYYSIIGLIAIFSAAVVPIAIMVKPITNSEIFNIKAIFSANITHFESNRIYEQHTLSDQ